jgi:hypothetical protein
MSDTKFNKLIKFPENKNANDILDTTYLENISALNSYAFANNIHLKKIYIPNTIVEIGEYVFDRSYNLSAFFDRNKYDSPFLSTSFSNSNDQSRIFYLTDEFYYETSSNNVKLKYRINNDLSTITLTGLSASTTILSNFVLTIPSEINGMKVTSIGKNAFSEIYVASLNLSTATNLQRIQERAFNNLSVVASSSEQNIVIPKTVSDIESQAFARIHNITNVYFRCSFITSSDNSIEFSTNLSNLAQDAFYFMFHNTHFYAWPDNFNDISSLIAVANTGKLFVSEKYAFANYLGINSAYSDTYLSRFSFILENLSSDTTTNTKNFIIHSAGDDLSVVNVNGQPAHYTMIPYSLLSSYGNMIGFGETAFAGNNYSWVLKFFNDNDKNSLESAADLISKISEINGRTFFTSNIRDIRFGNADSDITCTTNTHLRQYYSFINDDNATNDKGVNTHRYTIFYPDRNDISDWNDFSKKGDLIWFSPFNRDELSVVKFNSVDILTANNQIIDTYQINGKRLSAFGEYAFSGNNKIQQISFENSFSDIGEIKKCAFESLNVLRSFDSGNYLPNLSALGKAAFKYCIAISSVNLSKTEISKIESETFNTCSNLVSVSLPNISDIDNSLTFFGTRNLLSLEFSPNSSFSVSELSDLSNYSYLLKNTSSEIDYHIFSVLEGTISDNTFELDFSNNNKKILLEKCAFAGNQKLTGLSSSSNLSIGNNAFYMNPLLSSVNIFDNTFIENGAFFDSKNIEQIVLGKDIKYRENSLEKDWKTLEAFSQIFDMDIFKKAKNIELSNNNTIKYIPQYFCFGNNQLTSISIPESIIYIDKCAFSNCSNIDSITIPANVLYISKDAFDNIATETKKLSVQINMTESKSKTLFENVFYDYNENDEIITKSDFEITYLQNEESTSE